MNTNTQLNNEYENLVKLYNESNSMQEIEKAIFDIPLEIQDEVLQKFREYNIKQVLNFFITSNHEKHQNINFTQENINDIIKTDNTNLYQTINNILKDKQSTDIVHDSIQTYNKITNTITIDTTVVKLKNMLTSDNFSAQNFNTLLLSQAPLNDQILPKLEKELILSIYQNQNNNLSDEAKKQIAHISPQLNDLISRSNQSQQQDTAKAEQSYPFTEKEKDQTIKTDQTQPLANQAEQSEFTYKPHSLKEDIKNVNNQQN